MDYTIKDACLALKEGLEKLKIETPKFNERKKKGINTPLETAVFVSLWNSVADLKIKVLTILDTDKNRKEVTKATGESWPIFYAKFQAAWADIQKSLDGLDGLDDLDDLDDLGITGLEIAGIILLISLITAIVVEDYFDTQKFKYKSSLEKVNVSLQAVDKATECKKSGKCTTKEFNAILATIGETVKASDESQPTDWSKVAKYGAYGLGAVALLVLGAKIIDMLPKKKVQIV